jgi:hypothetical protein
MPDITNDLVAKPVDLRGRIGRAVQGAALGEREELAGLAARLAGAVGVEQDLVPRLERDGDRDPRRRA